MWNLQRRSDSRRKRNRHGGNDHNLQLLFERISQVQLVKASGCLAGPVSPQQLDPVHFRASAHTHTHMHGSNKTQQDTHTPPHAQRDTETQITGPTTVTCSPPTCAGVHTCTYFPEQHATLLRRSQFLHLMLIAHACICSFCCLLHQKIKGEASTNSWTTLPVPCRHCRHSASCYRTG